MTLLGKLREASIGWSFATVIEDLPMVKYLLQTQWARGVKSPSPSYDNLNSIVHVFEWHVYLKQTEVTIHFSHTSCGVGASLQTTKQQLCLVFETAC